ncbi:hypothetical protein CBW65_02235 [Tumebacillus avium]|uniref:Uncharacterized protein n=1 Tax=Tumebacillus avium TaxID=1903704 RepID=A0A1Y0IKP8_9BACL|nr:Imm74 family immunity protein [Tumebacillus avium]ARU60013.1 hypothetical protein CBW65_02235 [Tumebacillus avium]
MKITGTSSYIKVEYDNKTVKIQGEMTVGGFIAYSDTIKNWESPHENLAIDDVTKSKIIKEVIAETKNSKFIIEFE